MFGIKIMFKLYLRCSDARKPIIVNSPRADKAIELKERHATLSPNPVANE